MQLVTLWALVLTSAPQTQVVAQPEEVRHPGSMGWTTHAIGSGKGFLGLSLGAQIWKDRLRIRNLIGRGTLELAPGIRIHTTIRRREDSWQRAPLHPDIDEAYLEGSAFYRGAAWSLALNGKVGRVRYLRFPAPDRLAVFDQVPGISDLTGGAQTDYRGEMVTVEGAHRAGLGVHLGAIHWDFDSSLSGTNAVEWYGFFRRDIPGGWSIEGRAGALAVRTEPLGRPARRGAALFLGKQIGEFEVGGLIERRRGEAAYTGVMVRFRPTSITRALGAAGFDYTRSPEGVAVQVDIIDVPIGLSSHPPDGAKLVGEVRAVRVRTYWQQSYQRNEYEHRVSSWGQTTGPNLFAVVQTTPWRLDLEALVSPHTTLGSPWFRDRQGPAQLAQDVIYRFYRK